SEALNQIATLIQQVPGLRECINLTRGLSDLAQNPITLSDFEGPSCDFPAFERALRLYVSYYRSQAGWTLLPALVDFFSNIGTNGPPHSLAAELDHFVLTHEPDESPLRHSWPQIQKTLLADPAQVNTWLSADTLTLNRDLKKTLLSAGVNIADGFDANYTENITQAEQLLANYKRFDLSTPIMTVDSETDCEPFLKGAKSPHRAAQVLRQAIIPEATQASSTGFLRSIPLYEVRVANLMSLQTPKVDRITLTGLLQTTALRQLTRSFAETQLLMGKEASLLIEEIEGTAKSNYMAVADTKFELSDHRASLAVVLGEAKRNITAGYRTYYRGQLLKAADKLRELDATITRLNSRGGAATQAPPGLAKILNMPPEFTGESHKSNIGPINQSLIDLVGWVRDDYVRLHNIKERNYRLTVDQFKEQIDWYSGIENGRTVRPPRSTSFIGAEELTILQSHPVMQGLLTNHVQEILDGPRDLAIAMKELVAAHWPMLTSVDPRTGRTTEIWRTYTDKAFEKTLESHLSMIKGTTEVLFSQKDLDRTLTIGVSNRSLVDTVLRRFPSQKRAVCEEQIRIAGDKSFNAWVAGGFAALALGLSCTEVGAPAAVIPGAISLGISAHEAGKARIAAAQTHAYQVGSLSQRSSIERQNDSLYMRRLSDELLWRQIDTALSVGALATGGTIKFARLGKLLGSTERAVACSRVQTLRFFKNWPRAVAARASNPIVSSASRYASVRYAVRFAQLTQKTLRTVGETVLYPFHRLGLTAPMGADWRLFSELSPGLAAWQRVTVRGVHLVEDGAHLVVNLPLIPFGAKWGSGVAAKYLAGYGTYEIGNWGLHTWCAYRDAAMVVATARLSELMQNPEPDPAYAELIEAIYQGEITTTEAAQVLIYDARFTYQESINAVIEAAEPDPEVRRVRLRDLKRTIQSSVPIDANHRRAIDHAVREIDAAIGQI
ncbi:MAG: hypothetical protein HYR96_08805, partial [Deltaproteobacteria bacterium]|nr:hypothetical protein [Deltaproteobacteria bacterium]